MARTTLDLDEKLMDDLMRETEAPSKKAAIEDAMRERLNAIRRKRLLSRLGSGDYGLTLEDIKAMRGKPRG